MFQSVNPYSGKVLDTYAQLSDNQLHGKLALATAAYHTWQKTTLSERIEYLQLVTTKLQNEIEQHAAMITLEMGKPITQSISEIEKCISLCRYCLDQATHLLAEKSEVFEGKKVIYQYAPIGAILGIMPWNYPYWQVFRFAFPTLLAGNVVLLKHAPNCMGSAQQLESIFRLPANPDIFQSLPIGIEQVSSVIGHDTVQGVCLTGSVQAGMAVAALAGKHIKKSVLELGSADAFVLMRDAPFQTALDAAFLSRTLNAGQACIAAKRIFVPEAQLSDAIDYLIPKIDQITLGNPVEKVTEMGPIAKAEFVQKLNDQVSEAKSYGAKIITGCRPEGPFFLPGIMVSSHENPMNKEEIFGPVINLIPYGHENELERFVNDTPFGLAAAVWSTDEAKAIALAKTLDVGTVAINDFVKSDPRIPFGGVKLSGYGKELGESGMKSFVNEKVIVQTFN